MKMKKSKQRQHKDKILNDIPIFLAKTYRIVDNPEYSDTIEWISQENGFVVKNITDLTEKIFPKHFKHTNYASFVRQLNLYGFRKVRSNEEGHIFTHDYFQKNNPDLLPLIKRRNSSAVQEQEKQKPELGQRYDNRSQVALCQNPQSMMVLSSPQTNSNKNLQKQLMSLTQKHESIQNLVSVLVQQNKQIIMQNKSFINKINTLDQSYRKKLQTLIFLMVFGLKNSDSNIIVPQQLNHMIKAFTSSKKDKKSKNNTTINSNQQAVELFKKPANDQSRFNNKNIEEILHMLKMQGEGQEISEEDQPSQAEQNSLPGSPFLFARRSSQNFSEIGSENYQPPLSPIGSLRSLSSRYLAENKMPEDWNDFLDKLENSDYLQGEQLKQIKQ